MMLVQQVEEGIAEHCGSHHGGLETSNGMLVLEMLLLSLRGTSHAEVVSSLLC